MKLVFYTSVIFLLIGTGQCSYAADASSGCGSARRRQYRAQSTTLFETSTSASITTGGNTSTVNSRLPHNVSGLTIEPTQTPVQAQTQQDDWKQDMLALLNNLRATVGKNALALNSNMTKLAQAHSDYQSAIKTMTHDDTKPLGDRVTACGIRWGGVAENVAYNSKTVPQVIDAWTNSPGHYHNMIGDYEIVGFGETNLYWTQDFARYL